MTTTKTLYALRNLAYQPLLGTCILTKGYVFSTSERKAGAWFKREMTEVWGGHKPFLNGSSACPQFWVSEVDAEGFEKLPAGLPVIINGDQINLSDWLPST